MDAHQLTELIIFSTLFLTGIAFLAPVTKKFSFPFTVALLISGFVAQFITHSLSIESHIVLSPDVIFLVLLPILLFEGAFHINFHQFRIQFKTITAFATLGLLLSIFTIAIGLTYLAGLDFKAALLFGAIISATDPIAVLALFKHLGGPKRLALLADGESMFNDATGVVAFRVISTIILANQTFTLNAVFAGVGSFIYIFIGSIIVGLILGYVTSIVIAKIENDPLVEGVLTLALALGSFIFAEHYLHLSGVITTVMAAITLSHVGRTRISRSVIHFIEELWGFLGFICVSLVFFFAAYSLDVSIFTKNLTLIGIAILMVLIGRAVSVYGTALITNKSSLFKDEPSVPMSWLHILNWGGLRGVIPLVLVYTLPEEYAYREEMLAFTLGSLLFTLIINGLTIKTLLLKLGLNQLSKEEAIVEQEVAIFEDEKRIKLLGGFDKNEFDPKVVRALAIKLGEKQIGHTAVLHTLGTSDDVLKSLRLQALQIQRDKVDELFEKGFTNENAYFEYDAQLDFQQDSLEYPVTYGNHEGEERLGVVSSKNSYRKRLENVRSIMRALPFLKALLKESKDKVVEDRFSMVRARLIANTEVIDYLSNCKKIFAQNKDFMKAIATVEKTYSRYLRENKQELKDLSSKFPKVVSTYQEKLLHALVFASAGRH